jgi:Zn-dependent peptidase ImmA (M78 family)
LGKRTLIYNELPRIAWERDEFPIDEEKIQTLAEKYKVSEQALTLRLTYLGYIEQ